MGWLPLLAVLPARRGRGRQPETERIAPRHDAAAEGEARYATELRRMRRRLLNGLVAEADDRAAAAAPRSAVDAEPDLVSQLERLAALHRSGSLTYDEFQRAKAALLSYESGS